MLFFTDDLFLKHNTGSGHPENARRLESIMNRLIKQSWFNNLEMLPGRVASELEICLNHSKNHFDYVRQSWKNHRTSLDPDTVISENSFDAALLAAGAGLSAADAIMDNKGKQASLLLRPPGHHAITNQSMGFCIFNNIAICARYLLERGIKKIVILDWDVHHGNGTQDSFYDESEVLFISLHQYPCYPGSGAAVETGKGRGAGFNLNLPLSPGSNDEDYKKIIIDRILPEIEKFEPEFLLISAGFDAHSADPLAQMELSSGFFEWVTTRVLKTTQSSTLGRTISFLEGGYNLNALAESVECHLSSMLNFES